LLLFKAKLIHLLTLMANKEIQHLLRQFGLTQNTVLILILLDFLLLIFLLFI